MVGIVYENQEQAIINSSRYITEVEQDVYVYEVWYGDGNKKKEYILKERSQVMDPNSGRIIFKAPLPFNHNFNDLGNARRAANQFEKDLGIDIVIEKTIRRGKQQGDEVIFIWWNLKDVANDN